MSRGLLPNKTDLVIGYPAVTELSSIKADLRLPNG
jgi:hypothetical protein